ncbi:DNA-directed RNA polymerase subunit P [Candidatus Pacearchaeota archaeon]|nr:DNA-directed RNA polymerase subunit P [Candidatus Pacearchaeota archaeon]
MGYVCTSCNFRPKSETLEECPYCGKRTLEKERSAEQLIYEVNEIIKN